MNKRIIITLIFFLINIRISAEIPLTSHKFTAENPEGSVHLEEFLNKVLPEKIKIRLGNLRISLVDSYQKDIPAVLFNDRILIDPLFMAECAEKSILEVKVNTITINTYPFNTLRNKELILKTMAVYATSKLYFSKLSRKEKKYFRELFRYYPADFFRAKEGNFITGKGNYKNAFYYSLCTFLLNKSFHREYYPFTFLMLNSFFYNKLTDYDNNFHVRLTKYFNEVSYIKTDKGVFVNHEKRIKMLLFDNQKEVIKKQFNDVFPLEKRLDIDTDRIFGISLLIAGEEGRRSPAVGHTGLVILIADKGCSLKECLKNSKEHLVINPMGDTYLYEHSPVRKIIAGGLLAKFPLMYQVEHLSSYVEKLTNYEYRDVYISPPVLTREQPFELKLALSEISEIVNTNETKGYDFFKESCVHVCKNILTASEKFSFADKKHSINKMLRILPLHPIALWLFFKDEFQKNYIDTPLNKTIDELWHKFSKVINRYGPVFRFSNSEKNKIYLSELTDLNLICLAKDDGLSNFNRKKNEKTTKRLSVFFKDVSISPAGIFKRFTDSVLTVKEYVSISPLKRLEHIKDILQSYSSLTDKKKLASVFLKLELAIFTQLDQFFEKTKVYHDFLNKFMKTETFAYHFRCNLDLSMNRKIDEELTPFNLVTYLILHDKIIRNTTSFFEKSSIISEKPYNVASVDNQTFYDIERFYMISEQIYQSQLNGLQKNKNSFSNKFYNFYHQWRLEWELSAELSDTLKKISLLLSDNNCYSEKDFFSETEKFSGFYKKKTTDINFLFNWGFCFELQKDNLSFTEKRTQNKRLRNWR